MAKLFKDQLDGILEVLSVGFIKTAAVKLIQAHINELEDDIKIRDKAISEMQQQIDRLIENVSQLNREKSELEEKLEAADELVSFDSRESKKVVLPREVAEAIGYYQPCGIYEVGRAISREATPIAKTAKQALEKRFDSPLDVLMVALVNGYTVEEDPTTEERLEATLESFLNSFDVQSPIPTRELAAKLTLTIRTVLAEDRQAETQ